MGEEAIANYRQIDANAIASAIEQSTPAPPGRGFAHYSAQLLGQRIAQARQGDRL
jgi:hypothetical protein